jgi:hypothetical protein
VTSTAQPGILTASAEPDVARRAWPRWLALGLAMLAVAAVGLFWTAEGARVLLGATGLFLLGRGVVVLRGGVPGARGLGIGAIVAGLAAAVVAALSGVFSGWVLLVAVPVLLLGAAAAVLVRGGASRRGLALLVWALLLTALLVGTGLARDWDRATGVATVIAGLVVAGLAVPVLIGAVQLRVAAARPAPPVPAACAGCACGAGGCGALG